MAAGGRHFKEQKPEREAEARQAAEAPRRSTGTETPRAATSPYVAAPRSTAPRSATSAPQRPRRKRRAILPVVLIVVGVALLLTALGLFIKTQLGYQEAKQAYDSLEQYAVVEDSAGDSGTPDDVPTVDFDALAQINPDVVGWIYVPGTVINYPVVQTDNNSTYLTRMFTGENNGNGAIFLDMDDTAPGVVDQQTTLYGHHMYDASMFNFIDKSRDQATFDSVHAVYYITRDATYTFEPMFTAQVEDDYAAARQPNFGGDESLTQYLEEMLTMAAARSDSADRQVQDATQVLTLVTCAGEIVPRTTRATMVCTLVDTTARE